MTMLLFVCHGTPMHWIVNHLSYQSDFCNMSQASWKSTACFWGCGFQRRSQTRGNSALEAPTRKTNQTSKSGFRHDPTVPKKLDFDMQLWPCQHGIDTVCKCNGQCNLCYRITQCQFFNVFGTTHYYVHRCDNRCSKTKLLQYLSRRKQATHKPSYNQMSKFCLLSNTFKALRFRKKIQETNVAFSSANSYPAPWLRW